ncbi:hypothetical protein OGAPHI_000876 [Ogataea philodendri]|uniref:Amidase domain-containing protein n=1 Tax=Ogataea philodendri TaxID=1378263 RepID=A0A9P8TAB8_9ASCO|nr:uncharacterized protein OGAPHI_000876 [Ogataea philodendri]KAH3671165.1 hypothetical protein OGAPHI_000876 [Ogataea philodendri]
MPPYIDKTTDPVKFETWRPQIELAQKRLKDSLVADFVVPQSDLPGDSVLDVSTFPAKVMSPAELKITETDASTLVLEMGSGKLSAKTVLDAFMKRATIAHQLLNCATEFLADEAYERAKLLDEYVQTYGKPIGPLHGLPMSIKEHVSIKNRVTNAGFVALLNNVTPEDATTVSILRSLGAIPFVRTNEPQSLMHQDSCNYITGVTLNGFNRKLSPSGSSGGEGALIGFKGSVMGVGTDIGGSIRSPAAFNGCYGLRPTAGRVSSRGCISAGGGQESVKSSIGPLAQHLSDIELFMSSYVGAKPWLQDATLYRIPWKKVDVDKQLTVGIMRSDGVVKPHPPILRGLEFVEKKLIEAGVKVVEWEPYKCDELWEIVSSMYFADGCAAQNKLLGASGEPIHPLTAMAFSFGKGELTVSENQELNYRRDEFRNKYQQLMIERGVDVILCPAYVGVAAELGTTSYWGYCSHWNLLDQPGLVFPTGLYQDPVVDKVDPRTEYWNLTDEKESQKYVPNVFKGAPIALQLVSQRYEDEFLLAAGKIITECLR